MNERRPIDEDEFAQRLEQVELATQKGGSINGDVSSIEDPNRQEQFAAAVRVIGMIHRVRKSKNSSFRKTAIDDTAAEKLDTPRHRPADDARPASEFDLESTPADGTIPRKLGRFEIQRKLGQGGYGLVFLAIDPQLNREGAESAPPRNVGRFFHTVTVSA